MLSMGVDTHAQGESNSYSSTLGKSELKNWTTSKFGGSQSEGFVLGRKSELACKPNRMRWPLRFGTSVGISFFFAGVGAAEVESPSVNIFSSLTQTQSEPFLPGSTWTTAAVLVYRRGRSVRARGEIENMLPEVVDP